MDIRDTSLQVGSVSVRLRRVGRGRPVLFLHGEGGLQPDLPFFRSLARRVETLMPEHPGFGSSDNPDFLRNISDYAMFYLELLETLDLRDLHIVGSSLGGWLAAEIAVRDRSRLAGLTLISPAGIKVEGLRPGDNFIWNPEESVRNLFHDQSFADRILAQEPGEEELNERIANRYCVAKLAWQPRWRDPDLLKWLHRIRAPVQVIWGSSDKLFPVAYAQHWVERLPQAHLHIIDECGHLPHVEKSDQVADLILHALPEISK